MLPLWQWLLDLEQIDLRSATDFSLQWQAPLAEWMWFVILVVVPLYVYLIYRHEPGRRDRRLIMAGGRALTILLTLLLLCRPVLVSRHDRLEPSTVAIMLDQSASMAGCDRYSVEDRERLGALVPHGASASGCSRWDVARAILTADNQAMLRNLLHDHQLRVFRFAGSASDEQDIDSAEEAATLARDLADEAASGPETRIASCLQQAFEACIDAHLTSIVIISDGQPTEETDWRRVLALSRTRGSPVFVLAIGSPEGFQDLALREVQADEQVFLADRVAVRCRVQNTGLAAGVPFEIVLRDAATGEALARRQLHTQEGDAMQEVELQYQPRLSGVHQLLLEIPALEGELETANNAQQLQVQVVDDKVRVLYVDGYPRYEYRYLKNILLREPSIDCSILLLSADADFAQEGEEPIRRLPASMEELEEYDVILFGDVDPKEGWISVAQMELVAEFVNRRGGGFGLIAGERYSAVRFKGTPLERLIPIDLREGSGPDPSAAARNAPYRPQLTAAGRESQILRLLLDQQETEETFQHLPPWYWCSTTAALKPGTEVLLAHPSLSQDGSPLPLVAVGRYGAGRVYYQGADDTWRWRRQEGEGFFDTYWIQVVRHLARNKKFRPATAVTLRSRQQWIDEHARVEMTLEFEDATQSAALPDAVTVVVSSATGAKLGEAPLNRLTAHSRRFEGSYQPTSTGQIEFVFNPEAYALAGPSVHAWVEVERQSLESRKPQANLELMADLAQQTGGKLLRPWEAQTLDDHIPQRQYVIPDDVRESIWDSKLVLLVFLGMVTSEWILRKLSGLA